VRCVARAQLNQTQRDAKVARNMAGLNLDQVEADIARLAVLFGDAFTASEAADHRPLAVGIGRDIVATHIMSDERVKAALERYTARSAYLRRLTPGARRIDLNGRLRGRVNPGEALSATRRLAKIR